MMLSRVAERLYWMARYLERCEDTARLVSAYTHLILDLPRGAEPGWHVLIDTFDSQSRFAKRYRKSTERNVIKYLLVDTDNASSIPFAIKAARENVRTTRDVLPAHAWELVNELQLYASDVGDAVLARTPRFDFLEHVIAKNQQLNGLLHTSVTRDHAYWFIILGQLIERADMTSRVLRVATQAIDSHRGHSLPELPLLWANLLKSLSATAAYRRRVGPGVEPNEVIEFILTQQRFPRSIIYCLDCIEETAGHLKAPAGLLRSLRHIVTTVQHYRPDIESPGKLYAMIEKLQAGLGDIDSSIQELWFAADLK
ncbi:MAG: alpha-E domain-containing protein [Gammaproteobacteria bacterium]|jgi:uncharacterized alpha-E superfamily protein